MNMKVMMKPFRNCVRKSVVSPGFLSSQFSKRSVVIRRGLSKAWDYYSEHPHTPRKATLSMLSEQTYPHGSICGGFPLICYDKKREDGVSIAEYMNDWGCLGTIASFHRVKAGKFEDKMVGITANHYLKDFKEVYLFKGERVFVGESSEAMEMYHVWEELTDFNIIAQNEEADLCIFEISDKDVEKYNIVPDLVYLLDHINIAPDDINEDEIELKLNDKLLSNGYMSRLQALRFDGATKENHIRYVPNGSVGMLLGDSGAGIIRVNEHGLSDASLLAVHGFCGTLQPSHKPFFAGTPIDIVQKELGYDNCTKIKWPKDHRPVMQKKKYTAMKVKGIPASLIPDNAIIVPASASNAHSYDIQYQYLKVRGIPAGLLPDNAKIIPIGASYK